MGSFSNKVRQILDKNKPKEFERSCSNFWCKVRYNVNEYQMENYPEFYKVCPKCRSFDKELSGGVFNNGQTQYEGDRFDNGDHEILIKEYKNGFFK